LHSDVWISIFQIGREPLDLLRQARLVLKIGIGVDDEDIYKGGTREELMLAKHDLLNLHRPTFCLLKERGVFNEDVFRFVLHTAEADKGSLIISLISVESEGIILNHSLFLEVLAESLVFGTRRETQNPRIR
jgi:hypothetical protein